MTHPPSRPDPLALDALLKRARASQAAGMGAMIYIADPDAVIQTAKSSSDSQPLRQLPLVVKDNVDVAGMPTTSGSPVLTGHVPRRSAEAVARLQRAGAIVLGKTNLHELCFGITSNNAAHGPVRNPYARDRISGGSSGGTAAAIAAGLAPAGIGTDTGGSLRIPAALCGVVGFRPTTGRWPSAGVVTISSTRDTIGPMAQTVVDCALLDAVVCGEALDLPPVTLKGLRIGVPRPLFWATLEPSMAHAAENALSALAAAGVELVDCDVGIDDADCTQAGMVVALYEALPCLKKYTTSHGLAFDPTQIVPKIASPDVRGIFQLLVSADAPGDAAYAKAINEQRPALRQAYADCFARHNLQALVFPTTPLPAALIGEDDTVWLQGQRVPTFPTYTRNIGPGSFAGIPGISLPMGLNADGLPLGLALDGPLGSDRSLLAIARAIECVLPPTTQPPRSV